MDILIRNMNFNLEYIKGLGKNRDNLIIKKKIEDLIKKNHNKYFNDYRILLNLQLKLNKKKISRVYHPIRVSYYSTFFFKKDIKLILFSIMHNLLEHDKKTKSSTYINKKNLKRLHVLYIDNEKKYNEKYLPDYYKKIYTSDLLTKKLKCLDKLDNLFNLYKNNDKNLKKKYLIEVKKYILPLAKKLSKSLFFYLNLLYLHNIQLLNQN